MSIISKYNKFKIFINSQNLFKISLIAFLILAIYNNNIYAQPIKQNPKQNKIKDAEWNLSKKNFITPNLQDTVLKNIQNRPQSTLNNNSKPQNVTYVTIENADSWYYNQDINTEAQILVGNVVFSHDGVKLFCDSAYFYEANNSFDAYSNVLIQQGDTLFVYGDELYYDGNTKLARLRNNVLMDNLTATLETDSLNYDRVKNIGYYFDGGIIRDSLNTLVSETGHYYPSDNTAVFRKNVKLTNEKFVMTSDTLRYNTDTKVASILGPTTILYEEKTKIYSEYGWYNTENEQSKLLLNSYVEHDDGKRLEGDTIFYDKKNGKGEGFKNVHLIDTKNKVSLNGHYGYYIEKNELGIVTDSAMMIEYSSVDTLFLHSDTLRTFAKPYTRDSLDTITAFKDTVYKVFEGYHNVRFYRNNLQGVCDSTHLNTKDSVLTLFRDPIVWLDRRQVSGDTIKIFQKNEKLDRIVVKDKAFATDSVENKYFNQLSGKQMIGYMKNDSLRKIDILGNVKSIYFYVDEKDSSIVAMTTTESSIMNIYTNNKNNLDRIVIKPSNPLASLYPIHKIDQNNIYLENYSWQIALKPISKTDIFRKTKDITISKVVEEEKKTSGKKTTRRQVKPNEEDSATKSSASSTNTSQRTTNSNSLIRPSGFNNPNIDNRQDNKRSINTNTIQRPAK